MSQKLRERAVNATGFVFGPTAARRRPCTYRACLTKA